ncbi:cytochrome C oxidase subunit IV family protein [Fodinibius salsisoli]|uniref:Cytochrome C oxidase subunit IV family protein n=1 Tax=Fodinibius salsisoli TaxID=2820877 RepID=A0ABT3PSW9_9BACT|nr:cytochrome C oxidase subunit IV family protein [Fodinibius salsisoli]MCW9708976.1 cytochrome C oxidase subunit IV family protein [Fodinibius salsisoli]
MSGHHISTDKTLLGVAGALLILTIATVGVHYLHLPNPWSIIVAMIVAIMKGSLVAVFFMNLYWDTKFNSMLLLAAFLFFGLLVGLTLLDTLFRPEVIPSF